MLIDTPGLNDPSGKDSEHIEKMVATLKKEKTVNTFIIVFNGQDARMDKSLNDMLLLFQKIFGDGFLKNTMFEFSRWSYDKSSKRRRQIKGQTESFWSQELNSKLNESGLNMKTTVPTIFIDSLHNESVENEKETFISETKKLFDFVQNCESFPCIDFQITKSQLDEKNEIAKMAEKENTIAQGDLMLAVEKEKHARAENLQAAAISTMDSASRFISSLKREQSDQIDQFPDLFNAAMIEVNTLCKLMSKEVQNEVEIAINNLTLPINSLCGSFKSCLRNVKQQNELVNEEMNFYIIREKKYRDDKVEAEKNLNSAKLNMENTMKEVSRVKESIELAEERSTVSREAVAVSTIMVEIRNAMTNYTFSDCQNEKGRNSWLGHTARHPCPRGRNSCSSDRTECCRRCAKDSHGRGEQSEECDSYS